jgi:type IV secretion system pilin
MRVTPTQCREQTSAAPRPGNQTPSPRHPATKTFIHRRNSQPQASLLVLWWRWSAVLFALLTVALADPAHAEVVLAAPANSVSAVFNNIRNWLIGILAGLATVFITVGGVRRLMAGGDPAEVEKSKQAFRNAGWGYGLAALAPLVVEILKGIVGV